MGDLDLMAVMIIDEKERALFKQVAVTVDYVISFARIDIRELGEVVRMRSDLVARVLCMLVDKQVDAI